MGSYDARVRWEKQLRAWRPRRWLAHRVLGLIWPLLEPALDERRLWRYAHTGRPGRLHIADSAVLNDTLLNTWSGHITIGEHAFLGYGAKVVAGSHDYRLTGPERLATMPPEGFDVVIGDGVWVGENAVLVGPCRVGQHAVVAAGAVVTKNVEPFAIVGGIPARKIGDTRGEAP